MTSNVILLSDEKSEENFVFLSGTSQKRVNDPAVCYLITTLPESSHQRSWTKT